MQWLFDIIKTLAKEKFTGSVQLNFHKGQIANINENKTISNPDYVKPIKR